MKRILVLILALASVVSVQAQVASGLKYKDIKDDYKPRMYQKQVGDPYSPGWSAFASFVIPGLGQALSGEVGRGLRFFAGDVAISAAANFTAYKLDKLAVRDANGKEVKDADGHTVYTDEKAADRLFVTIIGIATGAVVYNIWSCCDAKRVAKVKNMYYQDLMSKRSSFDVNLAPYLAMAPSQAGVSGISSRPTAGLSLQVSF